MKSIGKHGPIRLIVGVAPGSARQHGGDEIGALREVPIQRPRPNAGRVEDFFHWGIHSRPGEYPFAASSSAPRLR